MTDPDQPTPPHRDGEQANEQAGPNAQARLEQAGPGERGRVSLDELADLHAGLLTPRESAALQARVDADPAAQALQADLDHTLALLADLEPEPMPDDIAARVDAALRAEVDADPAETDRSATSADSAPADTDEAQDATILDLGASRSQLRTGAGSPRGPRGWQGAVLVVAAAAVIGAVVLGGVLSGLGTEQPQPGSAPVTPTITVAELGTLWPAVRGSQDLSFLSSPEKLERCLGAAAAASDSSTVLGARPVIVDGQYGVLVAVPRAGDRVELLVLGPGCARFGLNVRPDIIARTVVPR